MCRTMPRTPTAAQVLGRIILVTGKEEFLGERTVSSVREADSVAKGSGYRIADGR